MEQTPRFSILIVDDNLLMCSTIAHELSNPDWEISTRNSGKEALEVLSAQPIDLAIVDLFMPEIDGLQLLRQIRVRFSHTQVIMLTASAGVKEAIECMKAGAIDFIQKPFSPDYLRFVVRQLFCTRVQSSQVVTETKSDLTFHDTPRLIGASLAMQRIKESITQLRPDDAPVLIEGESGTGKEIVARLIHQSSQRTTGPFITIDCASINPAMIENELFGHVKGSYTSANESSIGLLRKADHGTVFFDEVGELPMPVQAKLLRALQEKEVRPIGGDKSYKIDVRYLTATNRNLMREIPKGNFRIDLFYRINVLTFTIPPLRQRKEDIPLLARHFIAKHTNTYSTVTDISQDALDVLIAYDWPGNVRELENVIRRAMALSKETQIACSDLSITSAEQTDSKVQGLPLTGELKSEQRNDDSLEYYEKAAIFNALKKSHGKRNVAAKLLGIGEATLYRKLKKYHIDN